MKLVVISWPEKILNEIIVLEKLCAWGMDYFHLRKPLWNKLEIEELLVS